MRTFSLLAPLTKVAFLADNHISNPLGVAARRHEISLILMSEHIDWSRVDASTLPTLNLQEKVMRQPKTDLDQKPEYAVDDSVKRTRPHELY